MFHAHLDRSASKSDFYADLAASLASLLEGETDALANLSNASGLLGDALDRINWCGFYLVRRGSEGEELVLGPFQGKPACVRIAMGKGVCGSAAASGKTLVVDDVLAFPGHIACDEASRSEIVVPMVAEGRLVGVLDVDAPETSRFDGDDAAGLERFVNVLVPRIAWETLVPK
jgi:GAF domain-containing protein